jgi:hypothetical protein
MSSQSTISPALTTRFRGWSRSAPRRLSDIAFRRTAFATRPLAASTVAVAAPGQSGSRRASLTTLHSRRHMTIAFCALDRSEQTLREDHPRTHAEAISPMIPTVARLLRGLRLSRDRRIANAAGPTTPMACLGSSSWICRPADAVVQADDRHAACRRPVCLCESRCGIVPVLISPRPRSSTIN